MKKLLLYELTSGCYNPGINATFMKQFSTVYYKRIIHFLNMDKCQQDLLRTYSDPRDYPINFNHLNLWNPSINSLHKSFDSHKLTQKGIMINIILYIFP